MAVARLVRVALARHRRISTLSSQRSTSLSATRTFQSCCRQRYALPTSSPSSTLDPAEVEAQQLVDQGSIALESGDVETAKDLYSRSLQIKETATGHYNLGISLYQQKFFLEAIESWNRSIQLSPCSDAHTNLASAYILLSPSKPELALKELRKAVEISPLDAEIRFNLGAVNEANGFLEEALKQYSKAKELGIERADQNIRNVGAKLLRQKVQT